MHSAFTAGDIHLPREVMDNLGGRRRHIYLNDRVHGLTAIWLCYEFHGWTSKNPWKFQLWYDGNDTWLLWKFNWYRSVYWFIQFRKLRTKLEKVVNSFMLSRRALKLWQRLWWIGATTLVEIVWWRFLMPWQGLSNRAYKPKRIESNIHRSSIHAQTQRKSDRSTINVELRGCCLEIPKFRERLIQRSDLRKDRVCWLRISFWKYVRVLDFKARPRNSQG